MDCFSPHSEQLRTTIASVYGGDVRLLDHRCPPQNLASLLTLRAFYDGHRAAEASDMEQVVAIDDLDTFATAGQDEEGSWREDIAVVGESNHYSTTTSTRSAATLRDCGGSLVLIDDAAVRQMPACGWYLEVTTRCLYLVAASMPLLGPQTLTRLPMLLTH